MRRQKALVFSEVQDPSGSWFAPPGSTKSVLLTLQHFKLATKVLQNEGSADIAPFLSIFGLILSSLSD